MSTLIKRGASDAVPVAQLEWTPAGRGASEAAAHPLEVEVAELKRALSTAEAAHKKALIAARAQGRAEADAAHVRDDEKALLLLQEGIESAATAARERIASLDALALLLSQTALEKVFSEPEDFRDLIARAIRRQMINLRNGVVLSIQVSAIDFTDDEALAALRTRLGDRHFEITRDAQLPPGACRMDLRLGHIDLSVPEHWEALKESLRTLAETRTTP